MIKFELALSEAHALYNLIAYGRPDIDRVLTNIEQKLRFDLEAQKPSLMPSRYVLGLDS